MFVPCLALICSAFLTDAASASFPRLLARKSLDLILLRRIADYPNLSGYLRELYQVPGVRETVHFGHIKRHYYQSHGTINPTGVVPVGPELDLERPHGR